MALNQISAFNPNAVIGVGGYASAPLLIAAWVKRKPIFIQEQNAYAGLTNKWLGRVAKKIFVAFDQMDPYFPSYKMVLTGNPIRPELETQTVTKVEGCEKFKLDPNKPVLLVLGGSLGAPAINRAVAESLEKWIEEEIQVLWQTGKSGKLKADELAQKQVYNLKVFEFIYDMPEAFAAADLVVSRAGAIAITELCAQGKPSILVPSPYVAEDHQRINSSVLTRAEAAIMLEEQFISSKLVGVVLESISNKELLQTMSRNAHGIYKQGAAKSIAKHILKLTT